MTRSHACPGCGKRTTAWRECQACQKLIRDAQQLIEDEDLIVDEAGGRWWIWDRSGEVVVTGKLTRADAIRALAYGED